MNETSAADAVLFLRKARMGCRYETAQDGKQRLCGTLPEKRLAWNAQKKPPAKAGGKTDWRRSSTNRRLPRQTDTSN
ncbi:hypothetical protein HWE04_01600 [Herbaspirillum sp. C7C2]|uniref:hypothetical protein n=1 Tax=Herbaspirillum sp. C7C2 TaxID=2736666 RepID=UPI001F5257F4|nr:hypothetical protein [Herbaspirillum sp. C7C2]MCI1012535.1 hypothetical protein [Herbaspirillum sp. C7C2]